MNSLTTPAWADLWLNKGLPIQQVPDSQMIEIHGVRGYLLPGDVQYLWDLGTSLPRGATHLEVGSWMGLPCIVVANALIANLNFDARIHCIDTWESSPERQVEPDALSETLFDQFLDNVHGAKVDHFIRPLRGESARLADNYADRSIDSIFLDGDHSYEGCRRDLIAWLPKLKRGGRIGGRDAVPGSGVRTAVEEMAQLRGLQVEYLAPPLGHFVWEYKPAQ